MLRSGTVTITRSKEELYVIRVVSSMTVALNTCVQIANPKKALIIPLCRQLRRIQNAARSQYAGVSLKETPITKWQP